MIKTDAEFQSKERYMLIADAYVDQILALRAEIDDYFGIEWVREHTLSEAVKPDAA